MGVAIAENMFVEVLLEGGLLKLERSINGTSAQIGNSVTFSSTSHARLIVSGEDGVITAQAAPLVGPGQLLGSTTLSTGAGFVFIGATDNARFDVDRARVVSTSCP
jgi:hypothetical protein